MRGPAIIDAAPIFPVLKIKKATNLVLFGQLVDLVVKALLF